MKHFYFPLLILASFLVLGCGPTAKETRLIGELESAKADQKKLQNELIELKESDARRFSEIVALKFSGDLAQAKKAMEGFLVQYPKSELLKKARGVITEIDSEIAKMEVDEIDRKRNVAEAEAKKKQLAEAEAKKKQLAEAEAKEKQLAEAEAKKKQLAEAEAKEKQLANAISAMKASVDDARNLYFWQHKEQSATIKVVGMNLPKPGIFPYIGKRGKNGEYYLMLYCSGIKSDYTILGDITLRADEDTIKFEGYKIDAKDTQAFSNALKVKAYIPSGHIPLEGEQIKFLRDFSKADKVGVHFAAYTGNDKIDSSYDLAESKKIVLEVLTAYDALRSKK